ncbi:hypothetical protein SELMODRAFT_103038 [Selaginella moellendorffii]|uniref:Fibronectin type III-like domain-containing protein n=1 Tax=Selaginella moellendorffii TaxID=88036 RepID=D8RVL3_SELML|nr:probable beta-D-xylosidase 2 isoform X1 [Selaginella moellendorffii]EFJ23793.1 hypothetical protein SELMODRAFT_103038 [Selaginella moellendorffii]|eukprot:XP_002975008.1 probable beta-D-xylosidase 2 isoform X1 [Selaginella moellendorffii]
MLALLFFFSIAWAPAESRGGAGAACTDSRSSSFPFCDVSLPVPDRVADLVGRMNLSEKIAQIVSNASGIPRLGIPGYQWWEEALHGVAESPGVKFAAPVPSATSFPQVILTVASFNSSLWNKIAQAISIEAIAMYNAGRSGLTFWSPNINIFRDPRWGRGQETPGEDPLLSSKYAAYFVRGLQEGDYDEGTAISTMQRRPTRLKVSSCCKHFTAYDMEKSEGTDCFHFNAQVTVQDLQDTFDPPFRSCIVDGQASGLMCSYNRVNGVPSCADYTFLTETVRNSWGFEGYIVSDCDAVALLYEYINYTTTAEDAVADVLSAGMDLNCGTFLLRHTAAAIEQGKVTEAAVDRALSNVMTVRMRLGLFDGNSGETYNSIGPDAVCTREHRQLSLEAAEQGIVLLKNSGNVLPFPRNDLMTIAVIGPSGNATETMLGNYAGVPCQYITPFQGLQEYTKGVVFEPGCKDIMCNDTTLFLAAVRAAENSDAVVIVVGLDKDQEREGLDRTSLLLPGYQQDLVLEVSKVAKGPVILVVMSGGPIDVTFAKGNCKISSVLWVGYPGEAGGKAIARVIFGDHNPAGRLPMTWYPQAFAEHVSILNMHLRPNTSTGFPGRTYRFYTGENVYEFGHGLSYTNFTYTNFSAPSNITARNTVAIRTPLREDGARHFPIDYTGCEALAFKVVAYISNTGTRDSDHISLLYAIPPAASSSLSPPRKQLISFKRQHLIAGRCAKVEFDVDTCKDLGLTNEAGTKVLVHGDYKLSLGDIEHVISLTLLS